MCHIELPTLLFWENGNSWYGSLGNARFFLRPEPAQEEEPRLLVQFWCGPLAMEQSEITAKAAFPLSTEGLSQAASWLEERAAQV